MGPRHRWQVLAAACLLAAGRPSGNEELLLLGGACDDLRFLNGLVFEHKGTTASGAPYFKAMGTSVYIYRDPSCFGGRDGTPRWIIDQDQPHLTAHSDLDQDRSCNYYARIDSSDLTYPPAHGVWRMMCHGIWRDGLLILSEFTSTSTTTETTTTSSTFTATTATTSITVTSTFTTTSTSTSTVTTTTATATTTTTSTISTSTTWTSTSSSTTATATSTASTTTSTSATHTTTSTATTTSTSATHTTTSTATTESSTTTTTGTTTMTITSTGTMTATTTTMTMTSTGTMISTGTMTTTTTTTATTTATRSTATSTTQTAPDDLLSNLSASNITEGPLTTTGAASNVSHLNASNACCICCPLTNGTADSCCDSQSLGTTATVCCDDTSDITGTETTTTSMDSRIAYTTTDGTVVTSTAEATSTATMASSTSRVATSTSGLATSTAGVATSTSGVATSASGGGSLQVPGQVLRLRGMCIEHGLDGLIFQRQGFLANGAPYYRSINNVFLYYDLDCDGERDATPRWIVDMDAPDVSRSEDVDNDGKCRYVARVNSAETERPPARATWHMYCKGSWKPQAVTVEDLGTMVPATEAPPATGLVTSTVIPPPAPNPDFGEGFELSGACEFQGILNGLFVREGMTASGAPFYKMRDNEYYMYYDLNCNGGLSSAPRWIIDSDAPNASLARDLDHDQDCKYLARTNSHDPSQPLNAAWIMYCSGGWKELELTLQASNVTSTTELPLQAVVSAASFRPLTGGLCLALAGCVLGMLGSGDEL